MAHDLNYNAQTGKHSFFSVQEKAWHGLGTIVQDYPSSAEALKFAGLDYTVEKRNMFTFDSRNHENAINSGGTFEDCDAGIFVPNYYATLRTDTDQVLGVVGNDYQVVQNVQAFEFFDAIVGGKSGIHYETAGALGDGERVFITAKLPDFIRVGRKDCIEKYLFLTTSHDGLGSIQIAFTPVRIVCRNTLNAALSNQTNCIRIRHTASATDKLKEAHKMLGITNQLSVELEAVFNRWSRVRISDPELKRLIQLAMIPNKETYDNIKAGKDDALSSNFNNQVSNVFEYAMSNPTQQEDTTRGTLYGCYNAVTGYFQNVRSYKNTESKFNSIMQGTAQSRAQTAFNLCTDFAKTGNRALILN
jgi:phage/plasmid-like protein (TIGR03299 family)